MSVLFPKGIEHQGMYRSIDNRMDNARSDGLYFASRKAYLQQVRVCSAGRVINYYKELELNAIGIPLLKRRCSANDAMKKMLSTHRERILSGVPIKLIIDMELERRINEQPVAYSWLVDFGHNFISRTIESEALERCLRWDESFNNQIRIIKDALFDLGIDGSFSVDGNPFFCRDAAIRYLDILHEQGRPHALLIDSTLTGSDAYHFLRKKHGHKLPRLLCERGVYGVAYSSGYSCLLV